jgi:hypothetical protein
MWKMNFTGITNMVVSFCYHHEQLGLLEKISSVTIEGVKRALDERNIGG